ncbi:MAG: alkaline phosphatase family protein [Candidatus Aminicenantes bacterium]|nr:alkaline phosphatase family protein [Candidatus Aminicenantes bacterium]
MAIQIMKRILVLTIAALLLAACGGGGKEKVRVVVLGFDGANWPTIDPLIAEGKLPFIQKMKKESAWADFQTDRPTKSAVVWTNIATGKTMLKHGILDFAFVKANNIQVPYSNAEKREPSLWHMLDRFGLRTVVINWFVTYPPDQFDGVMVSDRFRQILNKKPEAANECVDTVQPSIDFYRLKQVVRRDYREILERTGLPDFPEMFQKLHPDSNFKKSFTLGNSRTFVKQDALVEDVTDTLFKTKEADLYMTYFRLPDVFQHFVLGLIPDEELEGVFYEGKDWRISEEKRREIIGRISRLMEPVYRYMDRLLQKYVSDPKFKDAYFLVMSDHGFSLYGGGYNHYNLPEGMEPPPGILMIKGPAVRPGKTSACIYDIAPTVLYLMGLPLDKNMDGKPLRDVFKLSRKVRTTTYRLDRDKKSVARNASDQDTLEELKALGYIN